MDGEGEEVMKERKEKERKEKKRKEDTVTIERSFFLMSSSRDSPHQNEPHTISDISDFLGYPPKFCKKNRF